MKNNIIILLEGGLGNQMFQFAFGSIIAEKNNSRVTIDKSGLQKVLNKYNYSFRLFGLDILNVEYDVYKTDKINKKNKIINKLNFNKLKTYAEPSFSFDSKALNLKKPIYIKGYFQSYKYFEGYEDLIRSIFSFKKDEIGSKNQMILEEINSSNSISIHIRRGDYINNKLTNMVHGTCSIDYYKNAINTITANKDVDFKFFFFSDDINWVKEKFNNLNYIKTFISDNTESKSWVDMFLMSKCKHNIIANSSFSFWGAWLNSNSNKKVIAPKKWFLDKDLEAQSKNLIPPKWIRI